VAYVAIPLGLGLVNFQGSPYRMPPVLPWLILAGLGTIFAMLRQAPGKSFRKQSFFEIALFLVLVAILVLYASDISKLLEGPLPYLAEGMPLVMLLFCGLWIKTFGMPNRADLQRYGALLGILCSVDIVAEAVFRQAAPTVRWIGNTDILAGLLLVSLCASLKPGTNDGGILEPDQGHPSWRLLTMLGIAACLSRTGLFAAAWIFLFFGRGRKRVRTMWAVIFISLLVYTFFLPYTPADAVRYIDYWLWLESARIFTDNPALLLTGFPLGAALPVTFPTGMGPIWEAATGSPAMIGAHLQQITPFWLRLTLAWGLGAPLAFMATIFTLLLRRQTRMGAGLTAAIFAQGMTTPLFFDPCLAIAIGLGLFLSLSGSGRKTNTRVKTDQANGSTPTIKPTDDSDPVTDWDLRPL